MIPYADTIFYTRVYLQLPESAEADRLLSNAKESEAAPLPLTWLTGLRLPPGTYYALATNDPPTNRTLLPWEPGGELDVDKTPDNMSRLLRVRSQGKRVEVGPRASVQVDLSPVALPN